MKTYTRARILLAEHLTERRGGCCSLMSGVAGSQYTNPGVTKNKVQPASGAGSETSGRRVGSTPRGAGVLRPAARP